MRRASEEGARMDFIAWICGWFTTDQSTVVILD
jgi:hypothetical protein